ncbi:MAG TPA: cysteine--tRNA ligase [Candidatus Paceibacterota bacterium]
MDIFLNNTLSGEKEKFVPLKEGIVSIYHCGPTVYWDQQIGNMRAMVMADLVRRTFIYNNYEVIFVRNYTDVGHLTGDNIGDADSGEDRMEKAAKREHLSPDIIADKYIQGFKEDIASLNVIYPTFDPRATHFIPDIIAMVQTLIDKGYAYKTPHAVYFDVHKFPKYTKLSRQNLDELEKGKGHGTASDENKKNPQDFSLWFFKTGPHANALQTWKSPFDSPLVKDGEGFPGWHIECSAMSKHYLGNTLDIHMGGVEHISIHHTNEIAQSESANGQTFVHYWLHNEHLLVDSKRMGKSEGNAYILKDILQRNFSPISLRYLFLQAHYRSKQNFTWESLEAAETTLKRLRSIVNETTNTGKIHETYKQSFLNLINDDFNIPGAVGLVWEILKDKSISNEDKRATLMDFDKVLGLELDKIEKIEIPENVQKLVDEREKARGGKDFTKSDELRKEIESLGFDVKDTDSGSKVTKT